MLIGERVEQLSSYNLRSHWRTSAELADHDIGGEDESDSCSYDKGQKYLKTTINAQVEIIQPVDLTPAPATPASELAVSGAFVHMVELNIFGKASNGFEVYQWVSKGHEVKNATRSSIGIKNILDGLERHTVFRTVVTGFRC